MPGYTALHRAASWGHVDCLKVLVAQGCNLQTRNSHGERAREAAARYGQESCVDYLDKAGQELVICDVHGYCCDYKNH